MKPASLPEKDKPGRTHRKNPLKVSIQRRLLWRLGLGGVFIAIFLAIALYVHERNQVGEVVIDRARQVAIRFNNQIRPLLDDSGLSDHEALQRELEVLFIAGNLKQWIGHLVLAGIYDASGNQVASVADDEYRHIGGVNDLMVDFDHRLSADRDSRHEIRQIEGIPHVHIIAPLFDSSGRAVAQTEGMFAFSATAVADIQSRIVRTILEVVAIVLVSTALLYPIILSLIGRLSRLTVNLLDSNLETLRVLGNAIAKRDSDTDVHNYRVSIYAVSLAEAVGLSDQAIRGLIKGAFLHDVGKIGVSDTILLKPDKLTDKEFENMKHHVHHGMDIVKRSDWLKDATEVVGYHHEQFAGSGYPFGLSGEKIPVNARVFAIADVFDALTSRRPYKEPYSFDRAIGIIQEKRGSHFDPSLVDAFIPIVRSVYDDLADSDADKLRRKLEAALKKYFSKSVILSIASPSRRFAISTSVLI